MPVDARLIDAATSILDNLVDALTSAGIDVPSRRYTHAGAIAQDFVGEKCAEAFIVSWQGTFAGQIESGDDPSPSIRCAVPVTHQFSIALFRCVPTLKSGSSGTSVKVPSAAEMSASAETILTDAMTLAAVLVNLVLADSLIDNRINIVGIDNLLPVGPLGAVGGTVLTIRATVI